MQSQIQPTTSRIYDPTPPPEFDTSTSSSTSQESSSSNNNINGLLTNTRSQITFRSLSTLEPPSVTTSPYTPAQNTTDRYFPTTFNKNMIHTNSPPNIATTRTLSRTPIPTIPSNLLHYNLSSTNMHTTQNSVYPLVHNTQG